MKGIAIFVLRVLVWIVNFPFALLSMLEHVGRWCGKVSDALVVWFFRMKDRIED